MAHAKMSPADQRRVERKARQVATAMMVAANLARLPRAKLPTFASALRKKIGMAWTPEFLLKVAKQVKKAEVANG